MKTNYFLLSAILLIALVVIADPAFSQCAMCQATAESSLQSGSTVAEGINKGILYLFFMPWIIMFTVGFFWWRNNKKAEQAQQLDQNI